MTYEPDTEYIEMCKTATEIQDHWYADLKFIGKSPTSNISKGNFFKCGDGIGLIGAVVTEVAAKKESTLYYELVRYYGGWFYKQYHEKMQLDRPFIWLPRQSDLQAMIDLDHVCVSLFTTPDNAKDLRPEKYVLNIDFEDGSDRYFYGDNYEQLWLQFVMWDLHEKYWKKDGKEWAVKQ